MLLIAGAAASPEEGRARAAATLVDGSAWTKFRQFVAAQGGDPSASSGQALRAIDEPARLPRAPLLAPVSGYVARLDAREVGYTGVELGGGRAKKGDPVDPAVGVVLSERSKVGSHVVAGAPLLWVHARTAETLAAALARLGQAYRFADAPVATPPVIHRVIRTVPAA